MEELRLDYFYWITSIRLLRPESIEPSFVDRFRLDSFDPFTVPRLSNFDEFITTTLLQGSTIFCCTVSSSNATIQLTLPSTMKSNVKEDRQQYYYRLRCTTQKFPVPNWI